MNSLIKKVALHLLALALLISASAGGTAAAEPKISLQALLAKRVPILLEFGRDRCKPCKYMKPILEDMRAAYKGKAIVMTVDMDANRGLVRSFRIRMMPTQVFLAPDGKEFFRHEGIMERNQIAYVFSKMGLPEPTAPGARPAQVPPAGASQPIPATQGVTQGAPR